MPRINDVILDCACHIYDTRTQARKAEPVGGSGFLVSIPFETNNDYLQIYVVTNEHVIRNISRPAIRLNTETGTTEILETKYSEWFTHSTADLAIYCLEIPPTARFRAVQTSLFVHVGMTTGDDGLGPGDEAFLIGRFIGHDGKQKNTPSVRFGNISMSPNEKIRRSNGKYQEVFMVECRSISGYSGSPVFAWIPVGSPRPPFGAFHVVTRGPWLLGVDCGHAHASSAMAMVVPAWNLLGIIE